MKTLWLLLCVAGPVCAQEASSDWFQSVRTAPPSSLGAMGMRSEDTRSKPSMFDSPAVILRDNVDLDAVVRDISGEASIDLRDTIEEHFINDMSSASFSLFRDRFAGSAIDLRQPYERTNNASAPVLIGPDSMRASSLMVDSSAVSAANSFDVPVSGSAFIVIAVGVGVLIAAAIALMVYGFRSRAA